MSKVAITLTLLCVSPILLGKTHPSQFAAIVEKHEQLSQKTHIESTQPQLLVFVSLSMPKQSLRSLAEQLEKMGGSLLLRGLHENSIRKTLEQAHEILGDKSAVLKIDPEAFQRFHIKTVPAVVITGACETASCDETAYDVIYGDIPLEDALEKLRKRAHA